MMQTRRQDLRTAMILAAASYIPLVIAAHLPERRAVDGFVHGMGLNGGPWTLALIGACAVAYMLTVDALFPIGRSKIDLARGACLRVVGLMRRPDRTGQSG